jgi:NAD(P)-dependent dehydrogenase (short-subunit alcohol dehydrogenase family)
MLEGKIALVTGASRGIGRAVAVGLAREGADVAINFVRGAEDAEQTAAQVRELGRRALVVQADVAQRDQVEAMVDQVVAAFGRIDILVANAGIVTRTPFLELTDEEWGRVIGTNLTGPFLLGQAVARQMVKRGGGGKIVNVTSEVAERSLRDLTHYSTSKGGLRQLTRGMAMELAPYGINVNAVAPGTTVTDINRARLSDPAVAADRLKGIPLGRFNEAEDVVGAVLYLCSPAANTVVGATIHVDGGSTIV